MTVLAPARQREAAGPPASTHGREIAETPASTTQHPWRLAVAVTIVVHLALLAVPIRFELARPSPRPVVTLRFEAPKPPEVAAVVPPEPETPTVMPPPPEPPPSPEPPPPKRHKAKATDEPAPAEASEPSPPVAAVGPVVDAVGVPTAADVRPVAAVDPVIVRDPAPTPIERRPRPRSGTGDVNTYARGLRSAFLQHRHYPPAAVRLGLEGVAKVRLSIDRAGRLVGTPTLVQSSGHAVLDEEALRVVRAAAPFTPLPEGIEKDVMVFVLPIDFFLNDAER